MPWERSEKAVNGSAAELVVFDEKTDRTQTSTGIAERYLSLNARQLLSFYCNEFPLNVSFARCHYVIPAAIVLDSSTESADGVTCSIRDDVYSVPRRFASYIDPVNHVLQQDRRTYDGRVTRLAALDNRNLVLQEASYFDGVATNFALDHRPDNCSQSLRMNLQKKRGTFGDFASSPLVNHIGVVCMVVTSDGVLIVQERSNSVTNRGGTLSASVSGAVNWEDVTKLTSPLTVNSLAVSILREALEELGIHVREIAFLGLLREFLRGGKPEVYFYARSEESYAALRDKWKQAEHQMESFGLIGYELNSDSVNFSELSRNAIEKRFREIMESIGPNANLTLIAGTALLGMHLLRIRATSE